MIITLDTGDRYEAAIMFDRRAIINMEGAFVMVDYVADNLWTLSGEPARPGPELTALNELVKSGTSVTVTRPDGSSETFKDE